MKMTNRMKAVRQKLRGCCVLFLLAAFTLECASTDTSYKKFVEDFNAFNRAPLKGRIIVIDPGHGGPASGAVGSGGLQEKDINLRVALKLKEYLEKAQAKVVMTRSDDREMVYSARDSMRGDDLDYRVRVSEQEKADLFLSLHHNSLLPLDKKYNATETYFKMEDFFASFDAAQLIHRHLVKNIQSPLHFMRPGNYYVLRNNTRTAVLGEASYISNPSIEKRLKKEEKADLEARSYFLGVLDYFSRGIPRITSIQPENGAVIYDALPALTVAVADDGYGDGIDPESIIMGIDGAPVPYSYADRQITALPAKPLTNGKHTLSVIAANRKGNHSLLHTSAFVVDLPPAHINITQTPGFIPPDAVTPVMVTVEIVDKNFLPVRDSTLVAFRIAENPDLRKVTPTLHGKVNFYYAFGSPGELHFSVSAGKILKRGVITVQSGGKTMLVFRAFRKNDTGAVLENVRIGLNRKMYRYTNREGYAYFTDIAPGDYTVTANLQGYYPLSFSNTISISESVNTAVTLEPVYRGLLFGKRIVVDPEYGGIESGATGPTGLRAADENMETARYLVQLLRNAGADALLTRDRGDDVTPYARVRFANAHNAELFVSLRHAENEDPRKKGVETLVYPSSTAGKKVGNFILEAFRKRMGVPVAGPVESAAYVLQQTGCPSVIVNLGYITNPETEEALYTTQLNRDQAFSLFAALVNFYSEDPDDWGEFSGIVLSEESEPVRNAIISIDQFLPLQTGDNGRFKFISLEPREHTVTIDAWGFQPLTDTVFIDTSAQRHKEYRLVREK